MTSAAALKRLEHEFTLLQKHLAPLRSGAQGGLTALRMALDKLAIPALAADRRGSYVAVNEAAAQLTGFSVDHLQEMSVWELTPSVDADTGRRLWAAFLQAGEQHGVYVLQGKHGPVNAAYFARAHVLPRVHVSLLLNVG